MPLVPPDDFEPQPFLPNLYANEITIYLNNPGMLAYDNFARQNGATMSDNENQGYAWFPLYRLGRAAMKKMFFEVYASWGIIAGLDDFVLKHTIVNPGYNIALNARTLCSAPGVGVDPDNALFGDLTDAQQEAFCDAYTNLVATRMDLLPPGGGKVSRRTLPAGARL